MASCARRADTRASTCWRSGSARASPASPAARCRRSATSGPTSARATSSTRSWSSCWAASASSPAPSTRRSGLGIVNKFLEGVAGRGARQDRRAGVHHHLHPEAAAGPVRAEGPDRGGLTPWRVGFVPLDASGAAAALRAALRRARASWRFGAAALVLFVVVPGRATSCVPAGSALHLSDYTVTLRRQDHVLRDRRAGDGPDLGLHRHPVARPRPVLRARRLRDGHVPDALDRPRRRLPQRPARLHGVPRLEGVSLVLELHRPLLVRGAAGRAGARRCSRSCSASSPSARASRACTSRSSRRR